MRVGIGLDVHAFAPGLPLVIGGVEIPSARGLAGHSDGDVLSHAIADAVLGAARLGDLGDHFSSRDPRWAGTPGPELLRRVREIAAVVGYRVASVDSTVALESPPIAPHRDAMRERIAEALGVAVVEVSVKATTTDGLGLVGRGEGAAALAVVTLESLR